MTHYASQSTIGSWFGITAIRVGKILAKSGLKDRNGPTHRAVVAGYAKEAQTREKIPFFVWDAGRIARIIDGALGDSEKPFLDGLVAQVADGLTEAEKHRKDGSEFVAELVEKYAYEGVPLGLVSLIRERISQTTHST